MDNEKILSVRGKTDIASLSLSEIKALLSAAGEPAYRAGQIYQWIHEKRAASFDEMTNLPASLRRKLAETAWLPELTVEAHQISKADGTQKFAFGMYDGQIIESVFMPYRHGNSVCVSSQAGCRMGCRFCASTIGGLIRNLTASEILSQVYSIERITKERVSNVVVMGTGEPLDNFEQVVRFIRLLSDPAAGGISQRSITVSTCGLVPMIDRLAEEKLQITLALSLHAPEDALRRTMMPIANRYTIEETLAACDRYFDATGRRVSYEYALIAGVNDTPEMADRLIRLLAGRNCHVNLIPVNPVRERAYKRSSRVHSEEFKIRLEKSGINATIRRGMGADIDSACGQLRRRVQENA